jgi:hypothetical protein
MLANVRNKKYAYLLLVLIALAPLVQAQDIREGRIVDRLGPGIVDDGVVNDPNSFPDQPSPGWRDRKPHEWTSMLFTIMVGPEALHELSPSDKALLSASAENISSLGVRAQQHLNSVCRQVRAGKFVGNEGAREVGRLFALADEIQEEDAVSFFRDVVASLSVEGRKTVTEYEQETFRRNASANRMDWEKYAALAPRQMLESISRNCGV